jgi:putative nucleotidyltransferase with HDIG domain
MHDAAQERAPSQDETQLVVLERLALTGEYHDDDSGQHAQRVGDIAARLARALGLDELEVALIRRAATLHDVGKAGVPDALLLKPARLTDDELAIVQRHATIGAKILSATQVPVLQMAEEVAFSHHERWDGMGYPRGLAGEAIPLPARIVAVADVFDALTHVRPYRPAWLEADAVAEIERQSGRRFDPRVVDAFVKLYGSVKAPAPAAAVAASGAGSTRTVLYIDDTLSNLEFVERILAHHSRNSARARPTLTGRILGEQPAMALLTAMDGQSGLALARERHPDLILLDLKLPDMSGEDVLRALRDDPATRSIPVAILSADTSRSRMQQMFAAGAQAYLTKPLDLKSFTEMLTAIFKRTD